jgi:hypothetical protein
LAAMSLPEALVHKDKVGVPAPALATTRSTLLWTASALAATARPRPARPTPAPAGSRRSARPGRPARPGRARARGTVAPRSASSRLWPGPARTRHWSRAPPRPDSSGYVRSWLSVRRFVGTAPPRRSTVRW